VSVGTETLRSGADAVLLARAEPGGVLVVEVANEAACTLFGTAGVPGTQLDPAHAPEEGRALLTRVRAGATRDRATREHVALAARGASRVLVDLQLEPLPTNDACARVLAVIRLAPAETQIHTEHDIENDIENDAKTGTFPTPAGVFRTELGLGAVFVDDALLALLGLSREQALGHGWLDAVHALDRPQVAHAIRHPPARGEIIDLECRIMRGGVEERLARMRGVPVRGDGGSFTGYLGSLEDLTDERRTAHAVAGLAELADVLDEWILVADPDLRLRYANPAARRGLGLPDADMLGDVDVSGLIPVVHRDALGRELRMTLETASTWSGDVVLTALDGRAVELECTVVAHTGSERDVAHYSLLGRDVTALRHVQRALDESEERFRLIADSSPGGIYFIADGGLVNYANRRLAEILDEPIDRVVGRSFLEWVHPDDLGRIVDSGELIAAQRRESNLELRIRRRSGETRWLRAQGAPVVDAAGSIHGYVGSIVDITEQRGLERGVAMLGRAIESTPDLVTFHDRDGRMFFANAAARDFFEFGPRETVPALGPADYLAAPDEVLGDLTRALETKGQWSGELGVVNRSGRRLPVEVVVVAHDDEDGRVEYYSALSRDLSERHAVEAARGRSEAVLRAIVQSSPLAIFALDRHSAVHVWNRAAEDLFGWSASEVVGKIPPFVTSETKPALDRLVARVFRGRTVKGQTHHYVRRDGRAVDVDVSVAPLRNAAGRVVTAVAILADVSEQRRAAQALRESEGWFRSLVSSVTDAICVLDANGAVQYSSPVAATMFAQATAGDSDNVFAAIELDDLPRALDLWEETRTTPGVSRPAEIRIRRGDGMLVDTEIVANNLLDDESVQGIVMTIRDITERKRAATLTANQSRILEQIARGVRLEETLDVIAKAVEEHFPRLQCAISLNDDDIDVDLDAYDGVDVDLSRASDMAGGRAVARPPARPAASTPILGPDGRTVLGRLVVYGPDTERPDAEQQWIFSLAADLAAIAIERKAFEDRLAHQSMHDPLTGLPNRLLFLDRLALATARGQRTRTRVAVLSLDLHRFKNINDSLGHTAGDELLVAVADRVGETLRPGDTVARFGGDEFTILCEDLPEDSARARAIEIAQRLLAALGKPFVVRGADTYVSLSIGIALTTTGTETADELLRDADAAMYHAKNAGPGRIEFFDDTIRTRALVRHTTGNALHSAIQRDELRLYFQPIVRLADARCVGAEALVRWQHPERGLVSPAEFVPLAEETGLVVPLGAWVLEHAAACAARWQQEQAGFTVAINLSARQLGPDLAEQVAGVIRRTGVSPSNICFEITESVLMEDADAVSRVIEQLRALGVSFAIDDFGTGYSSLGYLKRFAVDTVKIDRAFVHGLAEDPGDRAIVSAVVGLAHALHLNVVAEGVETEGQLTALVALGCDEAQGYFFAPPQPAADVHGLVSATRRWAPRGRPEAPVTLP
jgi:diguanylate cyclase (GGDEF)-like protein/PAS domain S-box-containing protein